MDDTTKMRVLMIYYEHWGKEEARIRKNQLAMKETDDIFRRHFGRFGEFLDISWMKKIDMTKPSFWENLTQSLLRGMNHYLPYDDEYDAFDGLGDMRDMRMLSKRADFADAIGGIFHMPGVYNATYEDMLRVNAIVAFP